MSDTLKEADRVPWKIGTWPAAIILILLSAIPLIGPDIPPLVDLPGHLGRYSIQLNLEKSPFLQEFYSFEWSLIGNLGVDLLVIPLSQLFGVEAATKLIVLFIPPLTVCGMIWIAHEVHGKLPPTTLFALPFAYSYPFIFGFVNSSLATALALVAFAFWLRMTRQSRLLARSVLFLPISIIMWVTHAFGWGILGLLAFGAEFVRHRDLGKSLAASFVRAALQCLVLAPPVLLMLLWRTEGVAGDTADWLNVPAKLIWLFMSLHDRWRVFDVLSVFAVLALIGIGLRSAQFTFSRTLAASTLLLLAAFILLPRILLGSAYADMRLAPYLIAIAVIALRPSDTASRGFTQFLFLAGFIFLVVRVGANTISFAIVERSFDRELEALKHVPRGARLLSFVGKSCDFSAPSSRLDHLPALATVRREAFSNDQWALAGAQLLQVKYPEGEPFVRDPSQFVTPVVCHRDYLSLDQALTRFPRSAFDYVWLIDPPSFNAASAQGLKPIWTNGNSVLFTVER